MGKKQVSVYESLGILRSVKSKRDLYKCCTINCGGAKRKTEREKLGERERQTDRQTDINGKIRFLQSSFVRSLGVTMTHHLPAFCLIDLPQILLNFDISIHVFELKCYPSKHINAGNYWPASETSLDYCRSASETPLDHYRSASETPFGPLSACQRNASCVSLADR